MLTRMEVGDIRYVTTNPEASELLRNSTVDMRSANFVEENGKETHKPYELSDIEDGHGTPFDKCLQLVIAADAYFRITGAYKIDDKAPVAIPEGSRWKDSILLLCDKENCAASGIAGMCELCEEFGERVVNAPISCSGYDNDPETVSVQTVVGLSEEVTDATRSWYLYLINIGFQRFTAGLLHGPEWYEDADTLINLFKDRGPSVAPLYGKELTKVDVLHTRETQQIVDNYVKGKWSTFQGLCVDKEGLPVRSVGSGTSKDRVVTLEACKDFCESEEGCEAFSYNNHRENFCILRGTMDGPVDEDNPWVVKNEENLGPVVGGDGQEGKTCYIKGNERVQGDGLILNFADGSSATAKTGYMTMLPYDMAALEGFGSWADEYDTIMADKIGAVKVVFGWKNASHGLSRQLGLKSCTEGRCERLILDGDKDWLVRQVWLWDPHTIMIYEIAPHNIKYPANNLAELARQQGMDAMVEHCFKQIREAVKKDIPDPDWARMKTWQHGSIIPGWKSGKSQIDIDAFVDKVSRPMGPDVPLFYGNSEMSRDGDNHGWAEGALEMVEEALPELTKMLGLHPPFEKYNPENFTVLEQFTSKKQDTYDVDALG